MKLKYALLASVIAPVGLSAAPPAGVDAAVLFPADPKVGKEHVVLTGEGGGRVIVARNFAPTHNLTLPYKEHGNPPRNPVIFNIVLGNQRQHIGLLRGKDMFDQMKKCLEERCPWGEIRCKQRRWFSDDCYLKPIYYNADGHKAETYLSVRVMGGWFPPGYVGLREALIDTAAGVYQAMTETQQNSYTVTLDGLTYTMYNINQALFIELKHWYGHDQEFTDPGAYLNIFTVFSGPTKEGSFDCVGTQTPVHSMLANSDVCDEIADIIQEPRNSIVRSVECPKKEITRDIDKELPSTMMSAGTAISSLVNSEKRHLPPGAPVEKRTINTVYFGLGSSRTHVGSLIWRQLGAKIRSCLDTLCPEGRGGWDVCSRTECRIENIDYNAGNWISNNAHLKLWVTTAYWPEQRYFGMREALVDLVANAFQSYTEDTKNCYDGLYDNRERMQMCNMGEVVNVHIDNIAWLMVKINFNGPTLEGPLDCDATVWTVRDSFDFRDQERKTVAKILDIPVDELGSIYMCEPHSI